MSRVLLATFSLLLSLAALTGCSVMGRNGNPAEFGKAPVRGVRMRTPQSPLDNPDMPGISLEAAVARIGRPIPLPRSIEASITKVVFFPAPDGSEAFELAVKYESGHRLYVRTGAHEIDALTERWSALPFTDGRQHASRELAGSRDVLINTGGVQSGRGAGNTVRPVALWNESGLAYDLYAPREGAGEVDELRKIVASVE